MCGPPRNLIFATAFLSLCAAALFAVGIATPNMITKKYSSGVTDYDVKYGWYRGCVKTTQNINGDSSETCKNYDADSCDNLPPNREQNGDNCDKFKSVKTFAIIATALAGGAGFLMFLLGFMTSCTTIPYILVFLVLNGSVAFGVTASAMYIDLARPDVDDNDYKWGYSMGVWLAGWIVNALASLVGCCSGAACGRTRA